MVTNQEIQDVLEDVRWLSAGLINQINANPTGLDQAGMVNREWFRQFVKAVTEALVLVTDVSVA